MTTASYSTHSGRVRPTIAGALFGVLLLLACSFALAAAPEPAAAPPAEKAPAAHVPPVQAPPVQVSPVQALAAQPEGFAFADVERTAKDLAAKNYTRPEGQVPDFLLGLSEAQWNRLTFKPEHRLWRDEGLPFEAQFFHPGFIYNRAVTVNVVDDGKSEKIPFNADMFDYGDDALAARMRQTQGEFAGFRLHFPMNRPDYKDEVVVFLGATYFRAIGKHTGYGLAARGVALNTAMPDGEEFPYFREFWLVKPEPGAASITVYALMDSPSMTGAFRFVITPGTSTVMDVTSTLYKRKDAPQPAKIGIAPLSSMYLFSETAKNRSDYRPEVHNSDGLLYTTGPGAWYWRPLVNTQRLAVSAFPMSNPRGFGLMQRDDNFDHYQDITARFDRRPSLWVEPANDWGAGNLEVIEIPSREEIHDNILVFWVPENNAVLNQSQGDQPPYSMSYRLYWMAPGVTPHDLGRTVATRLVRPAKSDHATFVIDFESEALNNLPAETGLSSVIETPDDMPLISKSLVKNPVTGGWRLQFKVRAPQTDGVVQSLLPNREAPNRLRYKALLKRGENLPDPLTETWIYDMPAGNANAGDS